jgi:hypothetical protein
MSRYSGKDLVVLFGGNQLEADFRSFDVDENITIIDASAGDDAYKAKLTGQKDGSATFTGLGQTGATGTAWWGRVVPGTSGTLEWAPEGTASTKPRHYVATAYVESRAESYPYEDVVEVNVGFTYSAVPVDTTYT